MTPSRDRNPSLVVLAATLLLAGCAGGGAPSREKATSAPSTAAPPSPSPPPSAAPGAEAKTIFDTRCTPCHGPQGHGDGPASKGLTPPPRDFSSAEWQDSVTDEHLERIILYGGVAVGKSPAMPPNPDLSAKPEVVSALRELVRSLKAP